jgi:hypothetical protein
MLGLGIYPTSLSERNWGIVAAKRHKNTRIEFPLCIFLTFVGYPPKTSDTDAKKNLQLRWTISISPKYGDFSEKNAH